MGVIGEEDVSMEESDAEDNEYDDEETELKLNKNTGYNKKTQK